MILFHYTGMHQAGGQGGQLPPQILADQKAPPGSGGAPHYYLPPRIFDPWCIPVHHQKMKMRLQVCFNFYNSMDHHAEGSGQKIFSLCSLLDCIMLAYGDSGYRLGAPFLLLCGDSTRELVPTPRLINREHYFLLKAAHFQMYDVVVYSIRIPLLCDMWSPHRKWHTHDIANGSIWYSFSGTV